MRACGKIRDLNRTMISGPLLNPERKFYANPILLNLDIKKQIIFNFLTVA